MPNIAWGGARPNIKKAGSMGVPPGWTPPTPSGPMGVPPGWTPPPPGPYTQPAPVQPTQGDGGPGFWEQVKSALTGGWGTIPGGNWMQEASSIMSGQPVWALNKPVVEPLTEVSDKTAEELMTLFTLVDEGWSDKRLLLLDYKQWEIDMAREGTEPEEPVTPLPEGQIFATPEAADAAAPEGWVAYPLTQEDYAGLYGIRPQSEAEKMAAAGQWDLTPEMQAKVPEGYRWAMGNYGYELQQIPWADQLARLQWEQNPRNWVQYALQQGQTPALRGFMEPMMQQAQAGAPLTSEMQMRPISGQYWGNLSPRQQEEIYGLAQYLGKTPGELETQMQRQGPPAGSYQGLQYRR